MGRWWGCPQEVPPTSPTTPPLPSHNPSEKWRDNFLVDRNPHLNGNGSLAFVGPSFRKYVEALHGTHIGRPVAPRTFTPEQLEQAQWTFKTNEHRKGYMETIPLLPFFYEKNWRKHYARAHKKERAQTDIQNIAKWSLPGEGGKYIPVTVQDAKPAIKA